MKSPTSSKGKTTSRSSPDIELNLIAPPEGGVFFELFLRAVTNYFYDRDIRFA